MDIQAAVLSVVRHILTIGGGALVTSGYLEASQVDVVVGALVTLAGVIWGIVDKKALPAS